MYAPTEIIVRNFLRENILPTAFCPGCGNGIIMRAISDAVYQLGYSNFMKFIFVSSIGCSGWIPNPYFKADSIHVLHGRAIPVAAGIKLCRPDLNVIVIGGDGDLAGIGLGHLIHAARRNFDLLTIMVNNMVFAMTGGQTSSTSPFGLKTPSSPYGNIDKPLNVCKLIMSTGANYVARWTVAHYFPMRTSIMEALKIEGFRFIEVISTCATRIARAINASPGEMIKKLSREYSIGGLEDTTSIGVFVKKNDPGFLRRCGRI